MEKETRRLMAAHRSDALKLMYSAVDIAGVILNRLGQLDTWKLQKLVYYSHAWSLAHNGKPLVSEEFQAWTHGPVHRQLYTHHAGSYKVGPVAGDPPKLDADAKTVVDEVCKTYGQVSGEGLAKMTHLEDPWLDARIGLAPDDRSHEKITRDAMVRFYGAMGSDADTLSERISAARNAAHVLSLGRSVMDVHQKTFAELAR